MSTYCIKCYEIPLLPKNASTLAVSLQLSTYIAKIWLLYKKISLEIKYCDFLIINVPPVRLDEHCNSFYYLSTVGKSSEAQTGMAANDTTIAPLPIIPPVTRPAMKS